MITETKINCMGTVSFTAEFPRMRKAQDFIVYPIIGKESRITIQSENRFRQIELETGKTVMSRPQSYANSMKLRADIVNRKAQLFTLPESDLQKLKAAIRKTAGKEAGSNRMSVTCDNSGAALI